MNPFLLPPAERLADWRQFRTSLTKIDDDQQISAVATYWAQAPLLRIAYDLDGNWPTIWEMIYANHWCRNTVAIGMEATLRLAGMHSDRLTLRLINDNDIHEVLLILVIDDRCVLNYDWGYARPFLQTDYSILCEWRYTGRDYTILDG